MANTININWEEHEKNLTEAFMKCFGFYNSTDKEVKEEIQTSAKELAIGIKKENQRLFEEAKKSSYFVPILTTPNNTLPPKVG